MIYLSIFGVAIGLGMVMSPTRTATQTDRSSLAFRLRKFVSYLLVGVLFGIIMTKSEAISWYRIQEMFRFQAFHMYGIIMSAAGLGVILVWGMKKGGMKSLYGDQISFQAKEKGYVRYLVGGTIFGLGWAMTGACPGPIYTLFGTGYTVYGVVLLSALMGTLTYGALKEKLPH